ncbi:hypothetical protein J6590_046023 [Homalodisca vitripennis]|nr:hypothetical protein J6590_046023 [Homalodisca vitripennis]
MTTLNSQLHKVKKSQRRCQTGLKNNCQSIQYRKHQPISIPSGMIDYSIVDSSPNLLLIPPSLQITSDANSSLLTSQTEPHINIEEVHSKIKNLQDADDLETSLTLAVEAGSALLAENSKLKQEIHELTQKNSQLSQHYRAKTEFEKNQYEAKIEDLELKAEALEKQIPV